MRDGDIVRGGKGGCMGVCVVQDRVGMGVRVHAGACLWVFARAHAFGYVVCVRMCKCVCAEAAL